MKRSYFKRKPISEQKPMKRTRLRVAGISTTAQDKKEIQRLVRLIVTHRDGGCVLRNLRCGNTAFVEDEKVVGTSTIQADHLVTRANSATYADPRLIVCICSGCHFWKKYHEKEYEKLVRLTLSSERKRLWNRAEEDRQAHKTYKMDWKLEIINLRQELKKYEVNE